MATNEAALYGSRALELLSEARGTLAPKYGSSLARPTLVEVFTSQADFAVRTFAMPQNDGFLGVCFGNVITANSPAAYAGHPFNWEAMLWHEFGHVITLNLTHNKMPRWLSEGISVYEERQHNPAWGENLTPRYREMILEGDLKPIGKLSEAFMSPPTGEHLQFAYYQSSLVVQFVIERFGFTNLVAILRDLGDGAEINQAIAKHTVAMATLEKDFEAYARKLALSLGPQLDWERPQLRDRETSARARVEPLTPPSPTTVQSIRSGGFDWATWAKARPTNFYAMLAQAQERVEKKAWAEAKPGLQKLVELCPEAAEGYRLLAETHRALGETDAERRSLERLAEREDAATDAYQRLIELAREREDWAAVVLNARRYRAVNPLVPVAYRFLAEAAEKNGDVQASIQACRSLLLLDPPDPAELHYRLARLLKSAGDASARREVLLALEEAPRYRDALRLLLEMHPQSSTNTTAAPNPRSAESN
jgi:tetratricopeptide (TPR) repeat protein